VIDAVIGVEIAISLVPPAAVIGIGPALGLPGHSLNAFYLMLPNVAGLDTIGSLTILLIRGIRRRRSTPLQFARRAPRSPRGICSGDM
jgi:uncharacterized membrane protein